ASANQRPVSASYPYYLGTSADFFDPGYRAADIAAALTAHEAMDASDFAALQLRVTDPLAVRITPALLAALRTAPPAGARQEAAVRLLEGWDGAMEAGSPAAAIWFTFWADYVAAVFQPWWMAAGVPVATDPRGLRPTWHQSSLTEDLEAW